MSRKQNTRTLTRIRQWDDLDELDELDELAQDERIRKQPQEDSPPAGIKQARRQHQKEWGRTHTRLQRRSKKNGNQKP